MIIKYSRQVVRFLGKLQTFGTGWNDIEEVEPDEWNLQMLKAIKADPECHEFLLEKDAIEELGLI